MWFLFELLWVCGSSCFFCLPSDGGGEEVCVSSLMGGAGSGKNWVLLWWDRALLSKALIQLSADGRGCPPSLVVVWPEATQPWSLGSMVGLMAPRRFMPRGTFLACCFQCPHPCGELLPTHASTGDPPTLAVSYGVTAPFLWVLVHIRSCLCLPRLVSLFPPVLWKSCNKMPLALKSNSLGIPNSFVGSESW